MAEPTTATIIFNDCSAGVITNVKAELAPQNSVEVGVNCVFDEVYGEAKVRNGLTILGTQIGGTDDVTGLYYFQNTAGTVNKLQKVVNGTIYHYTGGTWISSGQTDTANLKTRFVTFLDTVVRLNGTDAAKASTNGTSWSSSTVLDTLHFPTAKFGTVYKDQVVVAGVTGDPDTLYISSVPSSGIISWVTDYRTITINPEDGQNITALGEINGLLLVWKDNAMYTWNNRATESDEIINVGCSSQESVARCGTSLGFFNKDGVWITDGGQPTKISRPVQAWIDGMSSSYYDDVSAYGNGDYLYVSIGDCTVNGTAYTNVVLRYSVNTKEWSVFSYYYEFMIFTQYGNTIVGGDNNGDVYDLTTAATTDNSNNISFDIQSHDLFFGSRGLRKELDDKVMVYATNCQALCQVKLDDGDWKMLGTIEKSVNNFQLKEPLVGCKYKFRVVGISKNRARIQGLELTKMASLGYLD